MRWIDGDACAARLAANVLLASAPAVGRAGIPRALVIPLGEDASAEAAGKRSLLRRLLSRNLSVTVLKRADSASSTELASTTTSSAGSASGAR